MFSGNFEEQLGSIRSDFQRKETVFKPKIDENDSSFIQWQNSVIENLLKLEEDEKISIRFDVNDTAFECSMPLSKFVLLFNGMFNDLKAEDPVWTNPENFKNKTKAIYTQLKPMLGNLDQLIELQMKLGLNHLFMKAGPDGDKLCTYLQTEDAKEFLDAC